MRTKALPEHFVDDLSCCTCHVIFCNCYLFLLHNKSKMCELGNQKCTSHLLYNEHPGRRNVSKHCKENKTRNLKCNQCSRTFQFQRHYDKHMEGHNRNNCKYCGALYTKRKLLAVHLAEEHKIKITELEFPCKFCNQVFAKRATLHRHYHQHANGQEVCLVCGEFLQTKEELEVHIQEHEKNKKWTCTQCKETFIRTQQYQYHLKSHAKYKCEDCSESFAAKNKLKDHRQSIHNCYASKKYLYKEKLLQPQRLMHHNLTSAGNLTKHLLSRHEVGRASRIFKCNDCELEFTKRHLWVRHVLSKHKQDLTHKCEYCNQTFNCKENLKRHSALHTEDRQFVCEHCAAAFHSLNALKDHVTYVHSQVRDYVCAQCGKLFKRNNDLNRHMASHSEVRPFVCECGNSYKRSSHLRRHKESTHGEVLKSHKLVRLKQDESGAMVSIGEGPKAKEAKMKRKVSGVSNRVELKHGQKLQYVLEDEGNQSKKKERQLPEQSSLVYKAVNSPQPLSVLCPAVDADASSLLPVVDVSELERMCVTSDGNTIVSGGIYLSDTDVSAVHCVNENNISSFSGNVLHTIEVSYVSDFSESQPLYTEPSADSQVIFSNPIPMSVERAQTVLTVTLDPVLRSAGSLKIPNDYLQGKDSDGLLLDQTILSHLPLEAIPDPLCMTNVPLSHPSAADTILNNHSALIKNNSTLTQSETLVSSSDIPRSSTLIPSVDPALLSLQSHFNSHHSVSPYPLQTNSSDSVTECNAPLIRKSSVQDESSHSVGPVSTKTTEASNSTPLSNVADYLQTNYSFLGV